MRIITLSKTHNRIDATKRIEAKKALNKAFLKVKPNRTEIEGFKTNLIQLLDRTNDTESEEFHKNLVSDFLKRCILIINAKLVCK